MSPELVRTEGVVCVNNEVVVVDENEPPFPLGHDDIIICEESDSMAKVKVAANGFWIIRSVKSGTIKKVALNYYYE